MDGVYLHRSAAEHRDTKAFHCPDQFIERMIIELIQYEPETSFGLVFANENDRAHKIGILQEGIRNEQNAGCEFCHAEQISRFCRDMQQHPQFFLEYGADKGSL